MLQSSVKLTGKLVIKKFDASENLVYETAVNNLVVTSGKQYIAKRIIGSQEPLVTAGSFVVGYRYNIVSLGTTTQLQWNTAAGTSGVTYAVGSTFTAAAVGAGTGSATRSDAIGFMAIGDDASSAAASQTSLVNELARRSLDSVSTSGANSVFVATFPAGIGTGSIVEAALVNSPANSVISFDGDIAVDDTADQITYTSHGFVTGELVTYTDGGNTAITNLTDGAQYYIIRVNDNAIKLASSAALASAGTAINITGTSGLGHKLTAGTMLCRTTFPVITKSSAESIAIQWVITVG